ncbi:MAG: tetratricopeptide repeat protein [Gammaproteobacteria bacterium]|nr:tetratricopeptide repeat protein [Gammaproteobacteria bacterium]
MGRRVFLFFIFICLTFSVISQDRTGRYEDNTSMDVLINDNNARSCYRAAGIAARIHYTSSLELEKCNVALTRSALSPRDRAATLTNRGIIHMALDHFDAAISDFNGALELKPEFGEIHVNIGNIYFINDDYSGAVEEYTAAIEKETTKAHVAHINRGMAYEKMGDLGNAEQDYRIALELLPGASLPRVRLEQLLRNTPDSTDNQ